MASRSSPRPETETATAPVARRALLVVGASCVLPAWASAEAETWLRRGGVVLAMRHALAPGTFDPPGFTLGDCRTQRNLDDRGREQARAAGQWLASRGLQPSAVRSSPWCRCMDTATLGFGRAESWDALGSPHGQPETTSTAHLTALRAGLRRAAAQPGQFEVWVTHMFVLAALAGLNPASGEGWVLQWRADGTVVALARVAAPPV